MPSDDTLDDAPDQDADHLKELRAKARKADKLEAELRELRKKDAFRDAEVDLANPVGQFFINHYAGEIDIETIRAEAAKLGVLRDGTATSAVDPVPAVPDSERQSTDERAILASGAPADETRPVTADPRLQAIEAARNAIVEGRTETDALAAGIGSIIAAASAGDTRATWEPGRS